MLEVLAGVVVAIAALVVVLEPLLQRVSGPVSTDLDTDDVEFVALEESDSSKIRALLALREIEFDRATGKLSDEDYATLKAKYATAAVAAMRVEKEAAAGADAGTDGDAMTVDDADDAAEVAVRRARQRGRSVCSVCGPRPEPGAVFCSSCGRSLANPDAAPRCWICGVPVPPEAKYCPSCGKAIAA